MERPFALFPPAAAGDSYFDLLPSVIRRGVADAVMEEERVELQKAMDDINRLENTSAIEDKKKDADIIRARLELLDRNPPIVPMAATEFASAWSHMPSSAPALQHWQHQHHTVDVRAIHDAEQKVFEDRRRAEEIRKGVRTVYTLNALGGVLTRAAAARAKKTFIAVGNRKIIKKKRR